MSRSACSASSSSVRALLEHRLAVAHFLERVLMTAVRDLQRGVGRVEVGARRRCRACETKVSARSRVSFASSSTALAPAGRRPSSRDRRPSSLPVGREAEAGPGLAAAPPAACCTRSLKSVGASRATTCPRVTGCRDRRTARQPARHLQAEGHLFLGRQRARDRHGAHEPILDRRRHLNGASRARVPARVARASIRPGPGALGARLLQPASVDVSAATANHAAQPLHDLIARADHGPGASSARFYALHRAPIAGLFLRP